MSVLTKNCLDITILHSVVSSAQDQFNRSPHPKPLPAAVLFKAYDDVLPTFGVDPDSDHHLSALVFRIGGENGDGSLLDKFEAILKRMGIVLDFGENATVSEHSYQPASLYATDNERDAVDLPGESEADSPHTKSGNRKHNETISSDRAALTPFTVNTRNREGNNGAAVRHTVPVFATTRTSPTLVHQYHSKEQRNGDPPREISTTDSPKPSATDANESKKANASKTSLISAMDRWRAVASTRAGQIHGPHHQLLVSKENRGGIVPINEAPAPPSPGDGSKHEILLPVDMNQPEPHNVDDEFSWNRAARARQIFLASKVFNRWADETAIRLEREAIARRHMVRFRCFNSWTQAPNSTAPKAKQLKAASAVQKLRRAVVCQEEQLGMAASLISQSHLYTMARSSLDYWSSGALARQSANELAKRIRIKVVERWFHGANADDKFAKNVVEARGYRKNSQACSKWSRLAQTHTLQATTARQVGSTLSTTLWIQEWWNQAETKVRAEACQRLLATESAAKALEIWCLQTRLQAFRRRCEYFSVLKYINAWSVTTTCDYAQQSAAKRYSKSRAAVILVRRVRSSEEKQWELSNLEARARWYIRATRLVRVFDINARYHKHQARLAVRRYLMMRYTQVSSKRRRRSFYLALSHWRSHAVQVSEIAGVGNEYQTIQEADRKLTIATLWGQQTFQAETSHSLAMNYRKNRLLDEWKQGALMSGRRQKEASELWASERQLESLKAWTISALQRSGQAHSAVMVQQRHYRETRNKALLYWRQTTNQDSADIPDLRSPAWNDRSNSSRKFARSLPRWRPAFRRFDESQDLASPMQTPSRSTGLSLPATSTLPTRLMDPVEELDGESVDNGFDAAVSSRSLYQRGRGHVAVSRIMSSTTPRAPIPKHIHRTMRYNSIVPEKREQLSSAKSARGRRLLDEDLQEHGNTLSSPKSKNPVFSRSRRAMGPSKNTEGSSSASYMSRSLFSGSVPARAISWQPGGKVDLAQVDFQPANAETIGSEHNK